MKSIKDLVKGNTAKFVFYRDHQLFYEVDGFQFPVPVEDAKGTHFNAEEKAIHLMRWIRKHIENVDNARESQ